MLIVAAIATVVANWHNVLRAINMASGTDHSVAEKEEASDTWAAKLPKPKGDDQDDSEPEHSAPGLPQTLVRIPTEHAPALQAQAEGALEEGSEE